MKLVFEPVPSESWLCVIDDNMIVVHRIGPSWGYTIWMGGKCVRGGYAWDWSRQEAQAEAETNYKELVR